MVKMSYYIINILYKGGFRVKGNHTTTWVVTQNG